MSTIRKICFKVLGFLIKRLSGKGLEQFKPLLLTYRFLVRHLVGRDIALVNVQGQKMHVDAAFGLTLTSAGTYLTEKKMTTLFNASLRKGMTVVDIGANIGYYTLLAARAVGKEGKVFSFEPEPQNYSLLTKNIKENKYTNITTVQKAVANSTFPIKLYMDKIPSDHSIGSSFPNQKFIEVECTTLDRFFRNGQHIDVIKIDAEGAEMAILQGMSKVLSANPTVIIFTELNPEKLAHAGYSARDYYRALISLGFKPRLINEKSQHLETASFLRLMKICEKILSVNLLCQRGEK